MKLSVLKLLLIALTIVGVVIPYIAFVPFIMQHGLDMPLIIEQAAATRIAAFAWLDVLVSAIVLLIVAFGGRQVTLRQAVCVTLLTCAAGVSAGLPLYFYFSITRHAQ